MSYGVKLWVGGARACFTRPEMKAERVSYDVITPSAARGILEAIHWKPAIRWTIDRIHVLKPIRFESVRRNEVGSKIKETLVAQAMNAGSAAGLGLSPNAARLSVRFWHQTTLGELGAAFHDHWRDMHMETPPRRGLPPSVPALALRTGPARKDANDRVKFSIDDVSPRVAGELMRAILTRGR